MKQNNVIFPIELISRELDYKLLVAALLLRKEGEITFCQHDLANEVMKKCNGGVYFGKNVVNPRKYSIYQNYKNNNFLIIHLDEEGAVYPGPESVMLNNLGMRVDINSLSSEDYVCTWGVTQEKFYKSKINSESSVNINTTGHTRFDLYREPYRGIYKNEVEKIKQEFGPYVLINTHFSFAVNNFGISDTFSGRTGYGLTPDFTSRIVEEWAEETQKASHFISLAHHLSAAMPDINFVLRPHPAEDLKFYKTALKGLKNILITNEGSVGPWLLGAELLIHDRCTTAIEAFFSNVPVINHKLIKSEKWDNRITNRIGVETSSNLETENAVKLILEDRNGYKEKNNLGEDQFNLIYNFKKDRVPEFIEFLDQKISNKKEVRNLKSPSKSFLYLNELSYKILNFIKRPIRFLFMKQKHREYIASKSVFPGFDKKKILKKLDFLEKLTGKSFEISYISERIFVLKQKNN